MNNKRFYASILLVSNPFQVLDSMILKKNTSCFITELLLLAGQLAVYISENHLFLNF